MWAERYDSELMDFFALQDRITESVVASIEPHLYAAEGFRSQRKPPESLDAWGFVMRAMPYIWTWALSDNERALAYLKRATEIDPGYARANSLIAWAYASRLHTGWASVGESLDLALASARLAVEQDGEDPWAHLALGLVHSTSRRYRPAVDELTASLELNPSFALGHAMLGMAHGYAGRADEGLQQLSLALRLSPRDPQQARYLSSTGLCHFDGQAIRGCCRVRTPVRATPPAFPGSLANLGGSRGSFGRSRDSCLGIGGSQAVQPDLSIDWIEKYIP